MLIFCAICFIAATVCVTASPPSPASLLALVAMPSVTLALSLFCVIDADIMSIDAVVCSTDAGLLAGRLRQALRGGADLVGRAGQRVGRGAHLYPQIGLGRLCGILQRLLHAVNGLGNACLLAGQAVHRHIKLALRVTRYHVNHFHLDRDVGLHHGIDGLSEVSIGTRQNLRSNGMVQYAGLVFARHLGQRALELPEDQLHFCHGGQQLRCFIIANNGYFCVKPATCDGIGDLHSTRKGT
jgi:hypothetical protein